MKNKFPSILNMGLSSIVTIFLILTLAIFASLSLLTARSDYALSKSTAQRMTDLTQANNEGEEFLKKVDSLCQESYHQLQVPKQNRYHAAIKAQAETQQDIHCSYVKHHLELSTDISVNETQVLHITVTPLLPEKNGDPYYSIKEWKVQKITDWQMDDSLPLYHAS